MTFTEYANLRLERFQEIVRPYANQILQGEQPNDNPSENIFQWASAIIRCSDYQYEINPFREDLRRFQRLTNIIGLFREDLRENRIRLQRLTNITENIEDELPPGREILSLREQVSQSVGDLEVIERQTNGYLFCLDGLTSFIRSYNANPPREHGEAGEELLRLRRLIGSERSISPQFLLPVDEQVENYQQLRALLERVASEDLNSRSLTSQLVVLARERREGALYNVNTAQSLTMSRQAAQRFVNNSLAYSAEDIRRYSCGVPLDYELERALRGRTFIERTLRRFAIPPS